MILNYFILFLSISIFLICCWIGKEIYDQIVMFYYISKIPGPPKENVIFGNLPFHKYSRARIFATLAEWSREFYPIYSNSFIHFPFVTILNPEDIELIMSNPVHNSKGLPYKVLDRWLKTGLLTSTGEKWQARRKILTKAFHFSILQDFVNVFNEESNKVTEAIKNQIKTKNVLETDSFVSQFTLKTIAETAMGTKLKMNTKTETDYKKAILKIGRLFLYRILRPWLFTDTVYFFWPTAFKERKYVKTLHSFTKKIIKSREEEFKDKKVMVTKRPAMLDLLLHAKSQKYIDDDGICEEVDTFMFEGHDTTAISINFTIMLISCHPKIQEELVEEMRLVLDGDLKKKPSYFDLQQLKFMERCIKESLRMYPSVNYITRSLGEDLTTKSGYFLKKNTMVQFFIYNLHHNPDIYPDPEKFDPDRFLPENCTNRHPFAYIPFSAGGRNCIGQKYAVLEIKAILCEILANFTLEPIDRPETIELVTDMLLRPSKPIKTKFVPRN